MMVAAMLTLSATATMAQKINAESIKSKLEKSDAATQNEKKATKASTWLSRGDEYVDAMQAPTESLFSNMEVSMLKITNGEPSSTSSETVRGTEFEVLEYPYFKAYVSGGKVVGWKATKSVYEGAGDVALE